MNIVPNERAWKDTSNHTTAIKPTIDMSVGACKGVYVLLFLQFNVWTKWVLRQYAFRILFLTEIHTLE